MDPKTYYQANKERIKAQQAKYRAANKEKLRAYNLTKVECECGCLITRINLSRHRKTAHHLRLVF